MREPHPDSLLRLVALVRQNPARINELAVLWTLPRVSPGAARHSVAVNGPNEDAERVEHAARKVIREAAGNARWAGAILGSSFYVGMAPALAMVYFDQILAVLRIAAMYGRDPNKPARAAEILVIQGHYRTVTLAEAALGAATTPSTSPSRSALTRTERLAVLLHALPSMIGLELRRMKNPLDVVIGAVEAVSFFLPVVSIPVWIYANSRATSRLGKAAISFYSNPSDQGEGARPPVLLGPPTARGRKRFVISLVAICLALGVLAAIVPLGRYSHVLPLAGKGLAELGLVVAVARIILMTRPFGYLAVAPDPPGNPDEYG
jgi:hypothetical protein